MTHGLLTPFRVGLVFIAGIVAFFVLLSFVARQSYSDDETYRVHAVFTDASGLGAKSRVQIAGIEVGIVEKVELTEDARARAVLRIRKNVPLRDDARITKRSASLLGDFLLDVYPGSPERPRIPDGGEIGRVVVQAGVEDVFAALGDVTRDIQGITTGLKELLASDEVGSIKEIIRSMGEVAQGLNRTIESAGGRLDAILEDVQVLTSNVNRLASGQQGTVEDILRNVRVFTDGANQLVASVNQIVGAEEGELRQSVASVRRTLDTLQRTLEGAEVAIAGIQGTVDDTRQVIARVDRGEGTLGKLLRDDGIAMKIDRTLGDVNNLVAPLSELQTHVKLQQEIHYRTDAGSPSGKTGVEVRLQTRPDKYYGVALVSEPRGRSTRETVTRVNPADGTTTSEQVTTSTDEVKFSAFFAKRYGPAVLRAGLLESTGGVGADLFFVRDRLRLTLDAFDWANPTADYPRVRLSAQVTFLQHLFLGVGVDDALNAAVAARTLSPGGQISGGIDGFMMGGLQFNDQDLKSLLTVLGAPSLP